jgi:pilus assembly protein CpaF
VKLSHAAHPLLRHDPPIVDPERGVVFSLRKTAKARITREELIASGTASAEMLDFLSLAPITACRGHCRRTGSGKTTDISLCSIQWIKTSAFSSSRKPRAGPRQRGRSRPAAEPGHPYLTRPSELEQADVDMTELLRKSLRSPDLLVLAEMRGKEAVDVVEAPGRPHSVSEPAREFGDQGIYPHPVHVPDGDDIHPAAGHFVLHLEAFPSWCSSGNG